MPEASDRGSNIKAVIIEALQAWEEYDFNDTNLWESFREDFGFQIFSEKDFKFATNASIRELRAVLRKRGVWVEKGRIPIAKALCNVLREKERTAWTKE